MFEKHYQLRYSDMDTNSGIKLSSAMDILQDISYEHVSHVGLNPKRLAADNVACLLGGWRIRFVQPLDISEPVCAVTGIMSVGKCEAQRRYELLQNGICKVVATAPWFTVDIQKMSVIRIPQNLLEAFESTDEPDNGLPYARLKSASNLELLGEYTVRSCDLDTNNHMNNVKSVEAALEFLPQGSKIEELTVRYCREFRFGDVLRIYGTKTDDGFHMEIQNQNNDLCVMVHANLR
ncbi:MAG: hypothetical protein IJ365_01250 [Clostridia bacterium]|nr:hypothetical protein [Clostridia bacterium]